MACECEAWIRSTDVPEKIVILTCTACRTEYTLYPNGQIGYEQKPAYSQFGLAIG